MKKMFIGMLFVFLIAGIFLAGCTKEKTYTCSKDSDCVLGVRIDHCCVVPQAFHRDRIERDPNIALYEEGKDYSALLPENCKNVQCAPLPSFKSIKAVCQNNSCETKWEQAPAPQPTVHPTPKPTVTPAPEPTTTPKPKIQTAPAGEISVVPLNAGEKKAFFASFYKKEDSSFESRIEQYPLPLDLSKVQNYEDVKNKLGFENPALLQKNGFMVFDWRKPKDVVSYYETLKAEEIPIFITSDSLLHLYHIQFDETLREIEEKEFFSDITLLSRAMLADSMKKYNSLEGDLKEAARRNAAFFSVGLKLLDPNAQTPSCVQEEVKKEIKLIQEHKGFNNSPIFIYKEDYSQYVPRGHYTRSEKLRKYFKAMMWYGRMSFLLKGNPDLRPGEDCQFCPKGLISVEDSRIQTIQALLIAGSIQNVRVNERKASDIWNRVYDVTSFYVGIADDLTPFEYIDTVNEVFGGKMNALELADKNQLLKIKAALAKLRNPKIFGGTGNAGYFIPLQDIKNGAVDEEKLNELLEITKGMRLMGQRFVPDSYIFQRLVSMGYTGTEKPDSGEPFTKAWSGRRWIRGYPRGLDLMAVLGSERALEILKKEGDTEYKEKDETYNDRVEKLGKEFGAVSEKKWHQNLYWSWLYSLKALLKDYNNRYPAFMQSSAWKDKQLNTALGSWAQLRHDTILYAKQSYTPVEIGVHFPGPEQKKVVGYVEPVPEFYARLLALNEMTLSGLKDRNVLSNQAERRIKYLSGILAKLLELSKQELENKELSDEDYDFIKYFGSKLESTVTGIDVSKGLETTVVADVHTCSPENKVLEEGTGYLRTMLVAYKVPDGRILVGAGPVFSYHEFKWPMNDRLTDEKWKEMLKQGQEPEKPHWINSFYSS